jgi:anti-sigma factor RsiW
MSSQQPESNGHEAIEAKLSDYVEGSLPGDEARAIEEHLAGCSSCTESLAAVKETVNALSGLHKIPAPPHFERDVAETIRRRSGGRFFGRRAFGDRVPLELLAIVALALGLALYFFLRSSETGSLRPFERGSERPAVDDETPDVVPRP